MARGGATWSEQPPVRPLFALACLVPRGGLLSSESFVDVHLYRVLSQRMLDGQIPYRDFFVEYPPGSIPAFLVPGLISQQHFQTAFRVEMLLCAVAAIAAAFWCLSLVGASRRRLAFAATAIGLLPLALGPTLLNGYDLWPTALTMGAIGLLLAGLGAGSGGALGLAAATKVFPAALLPLALVRAGRGGALRVFAAFDGAVVVACAYFLAVGPGGLRFSFWTQAKRGLHSESLGGSLMLALFHRKPEVRPPGSRDVVGAAGTVVATATTLLELAAVLFVVWLAARAARSRQALLLAAAASVAGYVAFGKVFSPQYLVWLVPLVPLVSVPGTALLAVAGALTQLWVLTIVRPFDGGPGVWIAVLRNLLVVAIYVVLVRALVRTVSTRETTGASQTSKPPASSIR